MMKIVLKRFLQLALALSAVCPAASAQRRVIADVEVASVKDGRLTKVTKSVCCTAGGRLVALYHTPSEYYMVTDLMGESSIYMPSTNEVTSTVGEDVSSRDELLMLFLSGRVEDLGLSSYGYRMEGSRRDGDHIVRTYVRSEPGKGAAKVEIAFKDYLPVYCGYLDNGGRLVSRRYFSHYSDNGGKFIFPERMVEISYMTGKRQERDSLVVRTLYSNVRVDSDDALFDFTVPSDARPLQLTK